MSTGPKLVHKQFNSPIGLYSQQNIKETLGKHLQNLDNGTVGIDFTNPATDKPGNLANSAVLRMLEEEERNRRGLPKLDPTQVQAILETMVHMNHRFDAVWPPERAKMRAARSWDGQLNTNCNIYPEFLKATKGQKKVVWPPTPETNGYHRPQQQQSPAYYNNAQQSPPQQQQQYKPPSQASQQQYQAPQQQYQAPQQQYQAPQQQYQAPSQQYQAPSQQYQAPSQQYQAPQQQYQAPQQQYQAPPQQYQAPQQQYQTPSQSAFCEGKRQEACGLSKLIPAGPGVAASSSPFQPGPPSPVPQPYRQPTQSNRWAPVSPQAYGTQPSYPSDYSPQPAYSPQPSEPLYQQKPFSPPPSTITLRQQTPVHQKPSPVFASQPAAASFNGGVNMRGDQKWPPQNIKEAVDAENAARKQLAKGPACRPRKVKKDYSSFFAQHALNNTYPGYRAPPGTQHYEEHSGRSSY